MRLLTIAVLACLLGACASPPLPPALAERAASSRELLLLGEQHDASGHRRLQRQVIEMLAAQGRLAALAVEMAEQGRSTAGLGSAASEHTVRDALHWNEAGW